MLDTSIMMHVGDDTKVEFGGIYGAAPTIDLDDDGSRVTIFFRSPESLRRMADAVNAALSALDPES